MDDPYAERAHAIAEALARRIEIEDNEMPIEKQAAYVANVQNALEALAYVSLGNREAEAVAALNVYEAQKKIVLFDMPTEARGSEMEVDILTGQLEKLYGDRVTEETLTQTGAFHGSVGGSHRKHGAV
jgi:hypothetical protein